ncbi:PREDICTED: ankyrin repeat domain-containing protein 40-like isoform X2 [Priapulus caudatus]|uniref:Ankyrin repeat domain-containing protein 40-like isoform X2 n=1 Tax=Priapulus caudatus TaxID=37621 RepID=A0ABM1DNL5_PRICU|nr:PREDICTED: ankyrin repeat domain-containing protein 40-like isoform X2 [Priapulus caudatus]
MAVITGVKAVEEQLREASCIGNYETVQSLIYGGVDVNSQHDINGWTALHWAARRGHDTIVTFLVKHGADPTIKTKNGESVLQISNKETIRKLLGATDHEEQTEDHERNPLPFQPSYLQNPPFPYLTEMNPALSEEQIAPSHQPATAVSPAIAAKYVITNGLPVAEKNPGSRDHLQHCSVPDKMAGQVHEEKISSSAPHCCHHCCCMQKSITPKLVLKVRIADAVDPDFIEMELTKQQLTFSLLLSTCCQELGIKPDTVMKVRKLPNTLLRNDQDVKRLLNFQEIELVLNTYAASAKACVKNSGKNSGKNGVLYY